jgi:hypothetical protein
VLKYSQLALVKKLRLTCEELKAKNKLLQEASELYSNSNSKKEEARPAHASAAAAAPHKPALPAASLRPASSARRLVTPKQALMCNDGEDFKDATFLTNMS